MRSLSNLYKGRYTVTSQSQYCVINSNEMLARKLEALAASTEAPEGFREGLSAEQVEVPQQEPEVSLDEIRREADSILAAARLQADQLVADAHRKVEQLQDAAKAHGEQMGYEAGQKKAQAEAEEAHARREEERRLLEEEYQKLQEELEPQILDAVCQVFEKVFDIQCGPYREILLYLVKQAILKIESTREFQVRVSQKNYQYLEAHKEEVLSQVGQNIRLEIEADASLDEKQCVIEADSGFFECGIDVQFDNLLTAIRSLSV